MHHRPLFFCDDARRTTIVTEENYLKMLQKFSSQNWEIMLSVENSYFPNPMVVFLGAVNKGRPHKIAKNLPPPPLFAKCPLWLIPPCPCGHTINFEKSEDFLHQKVRTSASVLFLVRKMSALDKPPPTWSFGPRATAAFSECNKLNNFMCLSNLIKHPVNFIFLDSAEYFDLHLRHQRCGFH